MTVTLIEAFNDARYELFAAARELAEAREVIYKRHECPITDQQILTRYRSACLRLAKAAVRYTGARMRYHAEDISAVFDPLDPNAWFWVVDGIPTVKEPP